MTDELERLARRGRSLGEADRAEADDAKASEGRDAARAAVKVRHASVSSYVSWGWILAGLAVGVSLAFAVRPMLPLAWTSTGDDSDPATFVMMAVGAAPFVLFWLLRPTFGRAAVAREEARVRALPFPLTGYLEALGRDPSDTTVTLEIEFVDEPAPEALVADVFRTIGAEAVKRDGPRRRVARGWSFEGSISNNTFIARWVRRSFPILVALHGRHPIASVHVSADRKFL